MQMTAPDNVIVHQLDESLLQSDWPLHALVSLHRIEQEFEQRERHLDKTHKLMVCLHGIQGITDDAWEVISGQLFTELTDSLAIVFDSKAGFYQYSEFVCQKRFQDGSTVDYPVSFFSNKAKAETWLRQEIKEEYEQKKRGFVSLFK